MRTFDCPRTCRSREACRFSALFAALGPTRVYSHTTRVVVEFRDPDALRAAVIHLGGTWLGEGAHALYQGTVSGHGFTLPGWQYPLVFTGGKIAYDDYHGTWGNVADLEQLKAAYALGAARAAAEAQGWVCEDCPEGLLVYHPSGGTLTVHADGTCEAAGFVGADCHAMQSIEDALGRPIATEATGEARHARAELVTLG